MAHSSTTATAMPSDINYYFKDENGKILKLLKKTDIKQETSAISNYSDMGAFNQIITNQQQSPYVRISSSYNAQQAEVITSGSNHGTSNNVDNSQHIITTIKYESPSSNSVASKVSGVGGGGGAGFVGRQNHSMKPTKTKLNSTQSNASPVQRKRKPEKPGKGLRHFSMKVCEKVKEKGTTTYNEVADELVNEELQNHSYDTANCDQKNIRRRVYDALNVLMAMQIISKDKKEIRWIGLPTNSMEQCSALEKENEERRERIREKYQQLFELILQQVSFKALIERNKETERKGIIPTPNSSALLPFIIVNTSKQTKINCSVTNDKSEYIFKFDDKFEMHDDAQVLKRMGFLRGLDKGQSSYEDIERLKTLVPQNFGKYIEAYGKGLTPECDSDEEDMPNFIEITNDSQECFSRNANEIKTSDDLDDEEDEFLENSDND